MPGTLVKSRLMDRRMMASADEAFEFIGNVLESSTEYSIIGKDLEGRILLWNEGARRLYGYEPEEVVGRANAEVLHTPEDIAAGRPRAILDQALREGKWEGTIERVRKGGERFVARVVVTPRFDVERKAVGFLLISKDVSDEIRLTGELQAQQLYTRSLIESNIDALMTTDTLGVIADVNEQTTRLTGVPRNELIGTPLRRYFTDPARAEDGVREVLREGRLTNYEMTALARDGREVVVSFNASTFRDSAGRLQGVFAAARDITQQKALEAQLRDQQTYLRGLIESSVDGLVTVDEGGVITDVNDRICQMSGRTRDELIGSQFADHFEDTDRASAGVAKTFEQGTVTDYVLTLAAGNGRRLRVSFNASVFRGPDGAVRGIFASARDITDQARLQAQLAEERAYNRGLIEASVDGLVTVDPLLTITDVNETMCRMAGYTRAELVGSSFPEHFTDPKRAAEGARLTLEAGSATNYELTLRTRDEREILVSFNAAVFRDEAGKVRGIFASARDITDQARLQAQLAEQQAYNRSLIEASVDALFAIAPDGTITDVNEEATRLTARSRRQLVGSRFGDLFVEPERAHAGVTLTFAERRVLGYELTLVTRQGRRVPVSFSAGVFTDSAGRPVGILAAARDATKQKELDDLLRGQQTYTRSLIESNIDALMTTDQIGVITDVNKQMEELTGRTREELIGTPFRAYFTDPARADAGIRQVVRDGRVTDYELTAKHRDGRETVVSYNATTFFDQDGRLQGVFAAARDITDRRRFEQTLQEKNVELENASLAKDRFLASMSHELRTPLSGIIGYTGTLLMGLTGPLTDEQREQIGVVDGSARHLLSLINDLLDLAKIESGKVEIRPEEVDLRAVVQEVAAAIRPAAQERGLELAVDLPARALSVETDARALRQILLNLSGNAVKFTDKGSVRIAVGREDGHARISVQDTGIGISAADQAKLFAAFSRVGAVADREGTGLGLHLSQKLSEVIGGRITLESAPGAGSTFGLVLPLRWRE